MKKNNTSSILENQKPVVLAIGGLDPSGGAGIGLDAAAIRFCGCHPAPVAAVLTQQTGRRFAASRPVPADEVAKTAALVLEDLDVRAVKIGALATAQNVATVSRLAARFSAAPMVLDPVIRSSSGGVLLDDDGVACLVETLLDKLHLITPNLQEAELLSGAAIRTAKEMLPAAKRLQAMGARAVLVKGGHLPGDRAVDLLLTENGAHRFFASDRIVRDEIRGTGCALSSLIAGYLAKGLGMTDAVTRARAVLQEAIRHRVLVGAKIRVLSFDFA